MNAKELWQQKLIMLLHDPPGKAFFLRSGAGGHKKVAAGLFQRITGTPLKFTNTEPDRAAAGADRPVLSPPSRTKGVQPISVDWVTHPVVTHPLAAGTGAPAHVDLAGVERPQRRDQIRTLAEELLERYPDPPDGDDAMDEDEEAKTLRAELATLPFWDDEEQLRNACLWLWRRWPDSPPDSLLRILWKHQPADSRVPDHSLWDHNRVTSALAFMRKRRTEGATMPWLLSFSIGPVQHFIRQSRTGTDLWTSSMLLSDLIWHAMEPVVERYGPEAIVYPDLRENPRADLWLIEQGKNVLESDEDPCSYAGIFPNTFVALVPRGGDGVLMRLEELAEEARTRVKKRWGVLAALAYGYWKDQARRRSIDFDAFRDLWDRQHEDVLFTIWSAVAWFPLEKVKDPKALAIRDALPAQSAAERLDPEDEQAVERWRARHGSWIEKESFARYEEARSVYANTNVNMHQTQRGFDYVLVHHALSTRHALRKQEASGALLLDEKGEKCTLCGDRQAIGLPRGAEHAVVDAQRQLVRELWAKLEPNSDGGSERLCAVCAMKRVLIRAGRTERGEKAGLTAAWAGPRSPMAEVLDDDGGLRVPFPSTATLAAQEYLCNVATNPAVSAEVEAVVRAAEEAGLPRTTFVRALRSLAETGLRRGSTGRKFLEYDAEMTVFPEAVASNLRQVVAKAERGWPRDNRGAPIDAAKLRSLFDAISRLRKAAAKAGVATPDTPIAVIAIDGDSIRKVLLGSTIGARWQDVVHPGALEAVKTNPVTRAAGWERLLDQKRLMGPSTHAFVNRVLASFANVIVPWVVEQEFPGRLVYAGGDDVLSLAPAGEALKIAARLAELYGAAWVIDTQPDEKPWSWRKRDAKVSSRAGSGRFVIMNSREATELPEGAELLPMMGAGQTLSAGIAVAHYKTPLGQLVQAARDELEEKAKKVHGKNAFALRRLARSGEKATLCMSFSDHRKVEETIAHFQSGKLSARLPYKLREVEQVVFAAWIQENAGKNAAKDMKVKALAHGLFVAEAGIEHPSAFAIWWAGLTAAWKEGTFTRAGSEQGLAVCRYLGALARGEGDDR